MGVRLLHYSDIENAFDDPEHVGRVAGAIEARRDEETLVVGSGDNTAPSVLSLVTRGRHAIDFFDHLVPDVETLGNHDFDHGLETTRELIADSPQTWVCANAYRGDDRFAAEEGLVATTVVEAAERHIGFFGVLEPRTPSITPPAAALTVTDPIDAARDAVADLRTQDVDHVVALSHLGRGDDALARAVDADVILGGHLHTPRLDRVAGTLLTRPGANGAAVIEVEFENGCVQATRHEVADAPVDRSVVETLRSHKAMADLDTVVTRVDEPIERSSTARFQGESRIGNFIADAYRWATGADVGLQNSGGIRGEAPLDGPVTVADLIGVVPFDEPVSVAEVTGRELESVFEQAAGTNLEFGDSEWWHAHVSGARVVWDETRHEPAEVRVAGELIDPDDTYTLAASDYLFYTDQEFPVLGRGHRIDSIDRQYDVVVDYARAHGIDSAIEGRIVRAAAEGTGGPTP